MRHKITGRKLGRNSSAKAALLRNAATSLFLYKKIKTTKSIAKELQPYVEKLITKAKKEDFNARRHVAKFVFGKEAVKNLFDNIIPEIRDISSGYTKISNLDYRKGDGARLALIEIILPEEKEKPKKTVRRGRKKKEEKTEK